MLNIVPFATLNELEQETWKFTWYVSKAPIDWFKIKIAHLGQSKYVRNLDQTHWIQIKTPITCVWIGWGGVQIYLAIPPTSNERMAGYESVEGSLGYIECHHAFALSILHQQIQGQVVSEEVTAAIDGFAQEAISQSVSCNTHTITPRYSSLEIHASACFSYVHLTKWKRQKNSMNELSAKFSLWISN